MYQELYDKAKKIIKKDACLKFYDAPRPLFIETNAFGISSGTRLLQVRDDMNCRHDKIPDKGIGHPIAFTSKSLSSVEWCFSNTEYEALGTLYRLGKFHHYCFAREICSITDYKPLVVILSNDVATLPQQLQCIMLWICQYRVHSIYKPGLDIHCRLAVP